MVGRKRRSQRPGYPRPSLIAHRLCELALPAWQKGLCPTCGLTTHASRLAEAQQDGLRAGAKPHGLCDPGILCVVDTDTPSVHQLGLGQSRLKASEDAHMTMGLGCEGPGSTHFRGGVGQGADDGEATHGARKGQHIVHVREQDDRAGCRSTRQRASALEGRRRLRLCAPPVRIIEKTEPLLESQHAPHGGVHILR